MTIREQVIEALFGDEGKYTMLGIDPEGNEELVNAFIAAFLEAAADADYVQGRARIRVDR